MSLATERVKKIIGGTVIAFALYVAFAMLFSVETMASTSGAIREGVQSIDDSSDGTSLERIIELIINAILFLIGVVSVIMIIIGGFRYVVSNGDSSQTKAAKDTIMYAVLGLIIAIAAYAIINFVLGIF